MDLADFSDDDLAVIADSSRREDLSIQDAAERFLVVKACIAYNAILDSHYLMFSEDSGVSYEKSVG
jgi:hypothetical protein